MPLRKSLTVFAPLGVAVISVGLAGWAQALPPPPPVNMEPPPPPAREIDALGSAPTDQAAQ